MSKALKNVFIGAGILITTLVGVGFCVTVMIGIIGIRQDLSNILGFLIVAGITAGSLMIFSKVIGQKWILLLISLACVVLMLPKLMSSSLNFTLRLMPFLISLVLGLGAGYIYANKRKLLAPVLMGLFPLLFSFGLNEEWIYTVEYKLMAKAQDKTTVNFTLTDQYGQEISSEHLRGRILVMDMWFISCHACWVKFPYLEGLSRKYAGDQRVEIMAVNRPMRNDKPGSMFSKVEQKGYTFEVYAGDEQLMTDFGITYYPTIIVINQEGELVFKGGVEEVESVLKELLEPKSDTESVEIVLLD